jgi:hypothetical protein
MRVRRFLFLGLLFIAAMGYLTMTLWNWLIPALFNGPEIYFAQALGLMLLGRLLVGGWGKGHGGCNHEPNSWKARMQAKFTGISEEEKEAFKKRFCDKWD